MSVFDPFMSKAFRKNLNTAVIPKEGPPSIHHSSSSPFSLVAEVSYLLYSVHTLAFFLLFRFINTAAKIRFLIIRGGSRNLTLANIEVRLYMFVKWELHVM